MLKAVLAPITAPLQRLPHPIGTVLHDGENIAILSPTENFNLTTEVKVSHPCRIMFLTNLAPGEEIQQNEVIAVVKDLS